MEARKICPINPHGDGYCCGEKCALWQQIRRDDGSVKTEDCCFLIMSKALVSVASTGIEVYPS